MGENIEQTHKERWEMMGDYYFLSLTIYHLISSSIQYLSHNLPSHQSLYHHVVDLWDGITLILLISPNKLKKREDEGWWDDKWERWDNLQIFIISLLPSLISHIIYYFLPSSHLIISSLPFFSLFSVKLLHVSDRCSNTGERRWEMGDCEMRWDDQ